MIVETCTLVEELSKREGVELIEVDPYEPFTIETNGRTIKSDGPVCLLVIRD